MELAEEYKMLCPSAGPLEQLPIKLLVRRHMLFIKVYKKFNKPTKQAPGIGKSRPRRRRR